MEKIIKILFFCAVVGLLAIGSLSYFSKGNALGSQQAGERAMTFIKDVMFAGNASTTLMGVTEENGVYKFHFNLNGKEYDSYISKNGKLLFVEGIDIDKETEAAKNQTSTTAVQEPVNVEKSDKPDVKVFVMSYCPYGLQAQKMMLPVYNLLKGKADIGVYFVSYAMHGEKELTENLTQYCIQAYQNSKYSAYLTCFVKAGDSEGCQEEANIDTNKLATCVSSTDEKYKVTKNFNDKSTWLSGNYPTFNVDADLNTEYGVQGSPTIVINGAVVNVSPRTPENFKQVVCQAFNEQPSECSQTLSSSAPSAGLGDGTGSASSGSCN